MDHQWHMMQSSLQPDPTIMDYNSSFNSGSRNNFSAGNISSGGYNNYSDYSTGRQYGHNAKSNISRSISREFSEYSNILPVQTYNYNSNPSSQSNHGSNSQQSNNYYSSNNSQYTPPVSDFKIGHFSVETASSHDTSSNNFGSNSFSNANSAIANNSQSARETGIIEKLLQTYGFIQCCERQARLFFHFSQFEGNTEHLRIGDPVEFEVTFDRRTGKPIASSVTKISPEVVLSEERVIGFVTTELRSEHSGEQQGRITYENRGECFFLPYCQEDVEGYVTLKPGDKVSFQIATNQRSGNLGARHVRLENLVAPVKYRGVVSSIKDSYGFIERADVVDEIHFDFSEAKNIPEGLKLGDDVEFLIKSRNGKEVATDMIKLPQGTVVFEDINTEVLRGQVLKAVEEGHEAKQKDPLTGRIRYRGKDRSAVEVKFGERDQKGDFTLRHGDWVQFNIATDRRDHLQKATNISLLDDSFLVSGEKREDGIVCLLKEGFGFIKCADRDARMHFSYEELLDPQVQISVNDEVQFTVISDQSVQSPNRQRAIRIRKLKPGTVKFEILLQSGLEGEVIQEPSTLPISPSKTTQEEQIQPGVITYFMGTENLKSTVNFYPRNGEKMPMVGDKVNFDLFLIKRTKERIAVDLRVVSPIITSITPGGPRQAMVGSGRTLDRGRTNMSTLPSLNNKYTVNSSSIKSPTLNPECESFKHPVDGILEQDVIIEEPWKNGELPKDDKENGKVKKDKSMFSNGKDFTIRTSTTVHPGYIAALKESFGFIETENHDKEIFFHFSNVDTDPTLLELGQEVGYTISSRRGPNGKLSAENVSALPVGTLKAPKILGEVFEGTILRSMRSVNPDQDEYCGLVCVGREEEKTSKRHQFGITGLVNKKELLQPGDQVTFQLDEDGWAVNISAVRKKIIAIVEAVKGPYGFLNYETEEGKKLFFHQSEVRDGVTLTPGDEIQFVIITNHKTGKSAACNISRLVSSSNSCQRPDRLVSKLKGLNMDTTKPRIQVIRQPKGPDGTKGFKLERIF